MRMQCHDNISVLSVPQQRKAFATYRWRMHCWWQFSLNPVVSSNDTTYETWLAYLLKSTIIYDINHHLSPKWRHAFNAARTTLHMLRERIHILRKRPQDIPRSPRPRCVVMTSRTTDTQPLPHDRVCPEANLILRGQVRNSHHLARGCLPS
jgi:hypothetical protein